jgi:hypothetical protein
MLCECADPPRARRARHVVLGLPGPYSVGVARWVTDELITASG